jgi:hypothetical protein
VGVVLQGTPAIRWAVAERGHAHFVLSAVQGQEMVEPSNFEQSVGKAGFGVGDGGEKSPINGMKLRGSPVVNVAKMLDLGAPLSTVAPRGPAMVSQLGWEFARDRASFHGQGNHGC